MFEKYEYIGPKTEKEQMEINFLNRVEKRKDIIKNGPGIEIDSYNEYVSTILELLDIEKEYIEDSLSKGQNIPEIEALKRMIKYIESGKNPFETKDGLPGFFKI